MIVFHADLDNTLIYSYKRNIGIQKKCVEIYQGREISFMTLKTYDLLNKINDALLFVPTTTRTIEQYNRINLGIRMPKFALVCNGGILLIEGSIDAHWYRESTAMISNCRCELERAADLLEHDKNRYLEVRYIENLFVFTKSKEPEQTTAALRRTLDILKLDVFHNGDKVYVIPKKLSKGDALRRLNEKLNAEFVIAAGDSAFDISMLQMADLSFAPSRLQELSDIRCGIRFIDERYVFSDKLLECIIDFLE